MFASLAELKITTHFIYLFILLFYRKYNYRSCSQILHVKQWPIKWDNHMIFCNLGQIPEGISRFCHDSIATTDSEGHVVLLKKNNISIIKQEFSSPRYGIKGRTIWRKKRSGKVRTDHLGARSRWNTWEEVETDSQPQGGWDTSWLRCLESWQRKPAKSPCSDHRT